jgi:integrase
LALYADAVGRRKWVWKDEPPRFKPRRLASGKVLYYYQAAGKQIPLGSNRIAALEEWARLEAGGTNAAKFPRVTVLYREHIKGYARSTREHYCIALDNLDLAFKAFTLEQIEPKHIKAYIRRRTKKGAAMFEKRVGSAFFNWSREEGHTKAANPFHGVKFSKAERKGYPTGRRKRYVTDAEYRAVWSAGDAVLQDAMDLAYRTGQRPGDVLKARRQDIADGALWFAQEKTDERLGVNIVGELARVLERVLARSRAVQSVYLIADQRGQRVLYNALNDRFRKARGAATWQFRDIRAKTATDLPDLKKAQRLLGHADETTTNIYRRSRGDIVEPLERKI